MPNFVAGLPINQAKPKQACVC